MQNYIDEGLTIIVLTNTNGAAASTCQIVNYAITQANEWYMRAHAETGRLNQLASQAFIMSAKVGNATSKIWVAGRPSFSQS